MIKDENYYIVHGWMRNRLNLRGNELLIYAVLYGFTQDGKNEFRGTVEYIREFIGVADRKTVVNGLNKLVSIGFVRRVDYNAADGKTNGYLCVPIDEIKGIQKTDTPIQKTDRGVSKKRIPPSTKLKDKENYKETNKKERKEENKEIYSSSAGAGARVEDEENIFLKMTDKELIAYSEKPIDTSNPDWWKLCSQCREELFRRSQERGKKWEGKIITTDGKFERLKSHDEIIDKHGCSNLLKMKIKMFLVACYCQGGYVMPNDKLNDILIELMHEYTDDVERIDVVDNAIRHGYKDIKRIGSAL